MAQKPINMNLAKQVQQLKKEGVHIKEIVRRVGITRKTVKKYLRMMELLPQPIDGKTASTVTDKELAAIIYNNDIAPMPGRRIENLAKHFDYAKKELQKPGVTKQILWGEYLDEYPDGFKYSQYCWLFMKYLKNTDPAFHWEYIPGEFTQVDFAGTKLSYVDKHTGEVVWCEVFAGILPFSGLIFCTAVKSQKTGDFAHCSNEMVKYLEGVTKTILCDNLKTAVTRADKYEPVFTELCYQLSDHYTTTFSATRPSKPKDKAMIEKAIDIIYTNIYAQIRKETPGSLEELNALIRLWLDKLNLKPYKGNTESRRDIFEREERHVLKPLPPTPYLLKKCKKATVQQNYAVFLPDNKHYYTVPYEHVGRLVKIYFDERTVEVYYNYERIAFHVRSSTEPQFNRIHDHMPDNHKHMVEARGWTIEGLEQRAGWVGPYTKQAASRIIHSSIFPEQNYKACNTMILLQKKYTKQRLEAACQRAANITRPTLKLIRTILEKGMDKQKLLFDKDESPIPKHENIRGSGHYQ